MGFIKQSMNWTASHLASTGTPEKLYKVKGFKRRSMVQEGYQQKKRIVPGEAAF